MIPTSNDEFRDERRLSYALLRKADEQEFTPIGTEAAQRLLGSFATTSQGQGSNNHLIPLQALTEAGIDVSLWKKAGFMEREHQGQAIFEVPTLFAEQALLPVLRVLSQGVEKEMQEIRNRRLSQKDDKPQSL